MPDQTERLPFDMLFTELDAERLMNGYIPKELEDKWFIYFDDGWLYFHRSWSGHCIFMVKLDGSPAGVRVVDAWVNRDTSQYTSTDPNADASLLRSLFAHKLIPGEA